MSIEQKHNDTHATVEEQRDIQRETEQREKASEASGDDKSSASESAPSTAPRPQPQPPVPEQHLRKPGTESELDPRPRFMAPDYKGSEKLKGMTALITGGDSGIGRAVAVLFAREGANVAIIYLCEDDDARETCACVEKEGARCLMIAGDVKDSAFCQSAVQQTVDTFGGLDVLVNNAGFQEHAKSLEEITDEHLDQTLGTNIHGYINMTRAALAHMQSGASIINTGSETGLFGHAQLLDYSATKGAIHALTKSLASNLLSRGIRVNAVAPGPVWTPFNPADRSSEEITEFGAHSAMKRPAQPEELSPAYVFLAAPSCASYINGAILPVLGGPTG
jgi:NAD(P)-dependent dehydrogenase (short-subunit alcohol dehydrogenase family)